MNQTEGKLSEKLARFNYKGKSDLVYEEIRRAIMGGLFKPGDKLGTDQLATALRVSRMPVREAIKRLQIEGLVDVIPHKEATVAIVTEDQMQNVFAVRAVLEGLAAREAALRIGDEGLSRLWILYKEMEEMVKAGDTPGQLTKNREFHEAIQEISANKLLQSVTSNLFDSIERYRLRFMSLARRPQVVLEEHYELIKAIESHNPEQAEKLMRKHIEGTGQLMLGDGSAAFGGVGRPGKT